MKYFGLENNNLRIQILAAKMTQFYLEFRELYVLMELIFRFIFQFSVFKLKKSSKNGLSFYPNSMRFLRN